MRDAFYISAAVAFVSTLMVIIQKKVVHALLYLIISLLSVAVIFFTLGAPFAAALEVIIYAGAIMVLFVFVVMMLNLGAEAARQEKSWMSPRMWIGPSVLAAILLADMLVLLARGPAFISGGNVVGPKHVGMALFGPYLAGVELASMLLLAGLAGAYHLGRRLKKEELAERETRR
ncbi:MAG: NADH-quinone oxidoreductase subunit J [Nitrospiraceae bacterium]|nr:NADH-quinone oxidoreductase subunit J [Nitrospiraceae bacterium]